MRHSKSTSIAALVAAAFLSAAAVAADEARKAPATPGAKAGTIKGQSHAGTQVPAVQQGIQVNPGSQAAKSRSSPKARENLRGNLTNSPDTKSAPSAKSLISKPGGFSAGQ